MYKGYRIVDGHTHFTLNVSPEYMLELMDRTGTDTANLAAVYHSRKLSCVPEALMLKSMYPGRFYVFASLDGWEFFQRAESLGENMAAYARRMLRCGCDGVKLLEGKPQLRQRLPVPDFDAQCWEAYWAWAEREGLPMLWHVNDPETFWDPDKVPAWAKNQGWYYDESYVNNEAQYRQVLNVLRRHPALKIIFAHFFFMSAQLDRLSEIMDSFPNVMVDITPGIELYENLSAQPEKARRFFEKYHSRIVYGTDIGGRCVLDGEYKPINERENLRRPEIVRQFLTGEDAVISSDGDFLVGRPDFLMRGPGLPREQIQEIFGENFIRHVGGMPRETDVPELMAECARLRECLGELERRGELRDPDYSGLDTAERYFGRKS